MATSSKPIISRNKFAQGRRAFMARAAAAIGGLPLLSLGLGAGTANAQTPRAPARGQTFDFAIMGDMPYTRAQEPEYARVIADMNWRELAFVAHIGDMMADPRLYERDPKAARLPGDDESYRYALENFQTCRHPLVLTPGDNDWADYAEMKSVKLDPLERLEKLRSVFYPEGRSLGQRTMPVASQRSDATHGKYRENLRWSIGGVSFATFHIIGSNDNTGRGAAADAEYNARKAANLAWLKQVVAGAKADNSLGLVLITHANPGFENYWPASYLSRYFRTFAPIAAPKSAPPGPYDDFIKALSAEMETYAKPTALFHGDSHLHRIDKPLFSAKTQRPFENFTRIETFGWPDSHWIRTSVDPANPQLFTFTAQMVPGNRMHHQT